MCTSIRFVDDKGAMFFGRNLDWSFSYGEKVMIAPRGFKQPWAYNGQENGLSTESKPTAVIGMAIEQEGMPLYFDCANEAGLGVAGLNFPGFAQYESAPVDGKINVASYEFPYWVASHFETVDEAEEALKNVAIVGKKIGQFDPSLLHWIIADKNRSIVVEYMDSGLHVHHDDVDVLTNQPQFDWHKENLIFYMNMSPDVPADTTWSSEKLSAFGSGFGMLGLPGEFNSMARFVRVAYLNSHYPVQNTEEANVTRLFHTLLGVAMIDGGAKMTDGNFEKTIYTGGYSAATKTYYWNTYEDLGVKSVAMDKYDLTSTDLIIA